MAEPTEVRPWGWFRSLEVGPGFQVKLLHVDPGHRLSLQRHEHRAERWIVVQGTPTVRVGDDERALRPGDSVDIPAGALHRLHNPGADAVQVVEVQLGSYLGEDDITRLEDDYDRA